MTGISIVKQVYSILSKDTELTSLVSNKIYPLVAEETTTFPFCIIRRNNINVNYAKNIVGNESIEISVGVAATTYEQSIVIAERVRSLIELNKTFLDSRLMNVTEDFVDNAYLLDLTFRIID